MMTEGRFFVILRPDINFKLQVSHIAPKGPRDPMLHTSATLTEKYQNVRQCSVS
jgi:hypothetical protein